MTKESGNQILPFLAEAQAIFPLYKGVPVVILDDTDGPGDGEGKLDMLVTPPAATFWIRRDYPPTVIGDALFKEWLRDICGHELGHPYEKLVILYIMKKRNWDWPTAEKYVHDLYWLMRRFNGTWDQAEADASARDAAASNSGWQFHPRESWAESFKAALLGYWPVTPGHTVGAEKTYNEGKAADPVALRAFFLSLTEEVPIVTDLPFVDLPVANNNFWAGRGVPIDTVVIHSMAGTWMAANARFNNPNAVVSAHRAICYDGIIRRWVEDEYTAYHAGVWSTNIRSLGMECEDQGDSWGVRPDIIYSMAGAQLAEWVKKYPAIKLDKTHVVPGVPAHRDVVPTACPAGLDFDRIIATAKTIIQGGSTVAFDPINNASDRAWLDQRYANKAQAEGTDNSIKALLNPIAGWIFNAPNGPAAIPAHALAWLKGEQEGSGEVKPNLEPHDNMRGDPPAGHPAHKPRAGTHLPGKEDK